MSFLRCFGLKMQKDKHKVKSKSGKKSKSDPSSSSAKPASALTLDIDTPRKRCKVFTYRELATATNNFSTDSVIGHGGFGTVFKGKLESTGQDVAVKTLDESGVQGDKEFLVEVLMLSLMRHKNLVKLFGYCAEGDHRILVYEYMPLGSVEDYLDNVRSGQISLDWTTRMKIALGTAKGIEYLHNKAKLSVIYRDLKTANILLDQNFEPKLSDFGLAKLGPTGDKTHVTTRVMGTHGYCSPEYANTGKLTNKSDIYSFGVVMLELISGRRAISDSGSGLSRVLANWAKPFFTQNKTEEMLDPSLGIQDKLLESAVDKVMTMTVMCLREPATTRPTIEYVVLALLHIIDCLEKKKKKMSAGEGGSSQKKITRMPSVIEEIEEEVEEEEEEEEEVERELALAEAMSWVENYRKVQNQSDEASTSGS